MLKRLNIKVYGLVQGMSFRYYAQKQAEVLGILGFVRNVPDGTVYIEAAGTKKALDEFLAWCRKGPPFARIKSIDVEEGNFKNFSKFEIKL